MTTSAYAGELMRADSTDPRHGTTNGYSNLRCRCRPCTDAWTEYCKARLAYHRSQAQRREAS